MMGDETLGVADITEILRLLPHRYPFLLIDRVKGRDKRPGFDRLMMAVARREIDMVAAWSVDRLGRSLTDLLSFLRTFTRALTCSCISRGSIRPRLRVVRCFRCSEYSRSSSVR
jgi:DNA invertase Pin-like site-specific DNA recombinase